MNSIIYRIGMKDVFVSKKAALEIKRVFLDESISKDFVINIGDKLTFKKGTIRAVEVNPDGSEGDKNDSDMRAFYEEERKRYEATASLSADQKSKDTSLFHMLHITTCGVAPALEIITSVQAAQKQFFVENPRRTICDAIIYKPFLRFEKQNFTHYSSGALRLAEKAIFRDMQLSGQFKRPAPTMPSYAAAPDSFQEARRRAEEMRKAETSFDAFVSKASH